jgi:beta-galactosidase/beta-glucuronidase
MKNKSILTTTALLFLCIKCIFATTFVPDSSNRLDLNFNFNWMYKLGDQTGAEATAFNDASWEKVVLPHSVRLEPKVSGNSNYLGICWYRKSFTLDSKYSGRKIFIEFEAAMGNSNIWINGTALPSHYGGYLPFTVDVTSAVKFDGVTKNVIAVKVDNRVDPNTPPAKPQGSLDFNYFGGIYRNAWMHILDKTHITDAVYANKVAGGGVFVTYPSVSTAQATVQVKTNVFNENGVSKNCFVKTTIVDSANQVIATVTTAAQAIAANTDYTFTQTLTVVNPKLWHPNHPSLYTVYSAVNDGSAYVEQYKTRIGIRTIKMTKDKKGFWINGEQLELFGANRHQEYLYVGYALPNSLQYRDVKKMREAGLNFMRFGHYPMAPAFQDACDELGILCVEPNPGWQQYGGTTFQNRAYQDVRDMVRRDRNRPSVIVWESNLNETYDMTQAFAQNCHNYTHAEYPGDQCYTAEMPMERRCMILLLAIVQVQSHFLPESGVINIGKIKMM